MQILIILIILALIITPIYLVVVYRQLKSSKKKDEWTADQSYTLLRIDVPKNNDKAPLAAEQMFASIHGIFNEKHSYQSHLSFEVVAKDKYIQFYVYVPTHLTEFVEGQIYAQYPTVEIKEVESYFENLNPRDVNFATCELVMTKPEVYPIKLFGDFEVDPLAGITSVMSNLNRDEAVWLQLLIRPVGDEWQEKGNSIISAVRSGNKPGGTSFLKLFAGSIGNFLSLILKQAFNPGAESEVEKKDVQLPGTVEEALKGIEFKIMKLGFETKLSVLSMASDPVTAKVKCQNVAAAFKQFNTTNLNGFKVEDVELNNIEKWQEFTSRKFEEKGSILNISELASIYHLPHETVATPSIVWSGSKKSGFCQQDDFL
jgi:hypothetical protein